MAETLKKIEATLKSIDEKSKSLQPTAEGIGEINKKFGGVATGPKGGG